MKNFNGIDYCFLHSVKKTWEKSLFFIILKWKVDLLLRCFKVIEKDQYYQLFSFRSIIQFRKKLYAASGAALKYAYLLFVYYDDRKKFTRVIRQLCANFYWIWWITKRATLASFLVFIHIAHFCLYFYDQNTVK